MVVCPSAKTQRAVEPLALCAARIDSILEGLKHEMEYSIIPCGGKSFFRKRIFSDILTLVEEEEEEEEGSETLTRLEKICD